jgi:hypothetical protein
MDFEFDPPPQTDRPRRFSDTEIASVAAIHPISADVLRLMNEDPEAHRRLFRLVRGAAWNLDYRRDHRTTRQRGNQGNGWEPPRDDEKVSVLNALLGVEIARINQLPRHEVFRRASVGDFNCIAQTVRRRFIDHLRYEYAEQRGGLLRLGDLESSQDHSPSSERGDDRGDSSSLMDQAFNDGLLPSAFDYDYSTPVWRLHLQQLDWAAIEKQLGIGPAALLRQRLEDPDISSQELRLRLGVTDRTIRNYRCVLDRNYPFILKIVFGRET